MKVLHSVCQQIWKTQQWPQDWKRSVFIPIPKKGSAKKCSNYPTIALISYTSKVILKILQARLQQYMNRELTDVQASFRIVTETRVQIANICCIIEKASLMYIRMTRRSSSQVVFYINKSELWPEILQFVKVSGRWPCCLSMDHTLHNK